MYRFPYFTKIPTSPLPRYLIRGNEYTFVRIDKRRFVIVEILENLNDFCQSSFSMRKRFVSERDTSRVRVQLVFKNDRSFHLPIGPSRHPIPCSRDANKININRAISYSTFMPL